MSQTQHPVSHDQTEFIQEPPDISPSLPRNADAMFEQVERLRDEVYSVCEEALAGLGVTAELTRSSPYAFETWVQLRAWSPQGDERQTFRGEARIEVLARPGRVQPAMRLRAHAGSRGKTVGRIREFTPQAAAATIEFLLGRRRRLARSSFSRFGLIFDRNRRRPVPGRYFLAFFGLLAVLIARGRMVSRSEGRPLEDPRELIRMDSWQTVIISIGEHAGSIRKDVVAELVDGIHPEAKVGEEDIAYLSVDGSVRRRQIAVRFRRAIAFIEIHGYGDDLYADWEAYVNLGRWHEAVSMQGFNEGAIVRNMETVRSIEGLNEYDLSDANFLIEWVHACLTKVLRRVVKEQQIDQEIDFMILRADRNVVMNEASSRGTRQQRRRPPLRRMS